MGTVDPATTIPSVERFIFTFKCRLTGVSFPYPKMPIGDQHIIL